MTAELEERSRKPNSPLTQTEVENYARASPFFAATAGNGEPTTYVPRALLVARNDYSLFRKETSRGRFGISSLP